ncbi:MAG TPA: small ribosomal subunit Rsm22 family protein [Spirochaetales bacterium]|nr:small ribosomal subunit Rsm22 family protein [Spirochaetales bacterium]HPM72287.1 small ribosomal subunit Rsm22 family protein [Spirochaetales bacterium]
MLGLESFRTPSAPKEAAHLVSTLLDIVEEVAPLPAGRRKDIRRDVLELWRELTSEKSTRQPDYIGEPAKLAAYLRYFLPWNVARLVPLLVDLDLGLKPGDAVLDIGSGPLTVPIALWIARPDLRAMELRVECMDRVRRAMEIGLGLLEGLALRSGQALSWKLTIQKESFSITDAAPRRDFALVTSANVFNESFWRIKGSLSERADMLASSLGARAARGGRILIVEPGDPRSGAMLSALRESVILRGGEPLAPCPHRAACPMAGAFLSSAFRDSDEDGRDGGERLAKVVTAKGRSKAPWCHFVIDAGAAPERLVAFSETAGLPKDRLIASWLLLRPDAAEKTPSAQAPSRSVRLVSDAFRLAEGGLGRYACTRTGYSLVKDSLADLPSGTLALLDAPVPPASTERDPKSNAVIVRAHSDQVAPAQLPYKPPRTDRQGSRAADGQTKGRDGKARDHRQGSTKKPPITPRKAPRDDGGRFGRPSAQGPHPLAERSPYARSKKNRNQRKPKRSS